MGGVVLIVGVIGPRSERRRLVKRTNLNKKNNLLILIRRYCLHSRMAQSDFSTKWMWTDLDYSEDSVDYVEHNEPSGSFESISPTPEDNCPSPPPVVQTLSDNLDAPVSEEEQIQVEPVRYSGRGRKIIPRKGWEDFVPE